MGSNLSMFGVCKGLVVFLKSICHGMKLSSPFIPLREGTVSGDELPAVTGVDVEVLESIVATKMQCNVR